MNIKKYPVFNVDSLRSSSAVEYLGSKPKGWIKNKELNILFKQGRPGTGENWAEKVTSELAELLGLPHAIYDLAYLNKNDHCVISYNFLKEGEELRLGNQLIEGFDKNRRFKNTKHTVTEILNALNKYQVQLPLDWRKEQGSMIENACDLFIGYLCFDAWVANTDRHAENWGIITKSDENFLAPTFDHASSLGRNESDEQRIERLKTRDKGYTVSAYAQRAPMSIYDDRDKKLNPSTLVQECRKYIPDATDYWINKILNIMNNIENVTEIFDLLPDEFISQPAKNFAMAILKENTKCFQELRNG